MWLFDKLMNRKIEGKSSLDNVEPLLEKVEVNVNDGVYGVKLPDDVNVEGKRLALDSHNQDGVDEIYSHIDYREVTFHLVTASAVDGTNLTSGGFYHSYVVEDDNDPVDNVIDISDSGDVGGAYITVIDGVSNESTLITPTRIELTGEDPLISITDGDKYVDIRKTYVEIGDSEENSQITLDLNDPVRHGLSIPQSRESVINNIPDLVDSVYDFGAQSTNLQILLTGRGKYTFTELKGSNIGESSINISIVLPSFVKEIIRLGSDSSSIMEQSINTPTVRIPLPAGYSLDQRGEDTMNISVLITDYIAYVRYDDNY